MIENQIKSKLKGGPFVIRRRRLKTFRKFLFALSSGFFQSFSAFGQVTYLDINENDVTNAVTNNGRPEDFSLADIEEVLGFLKNMDDTVLRQQHPYLKATMEKFVGRIARLYTART